MFGAHRLLWSKPLKHIPFLCILTILLSNKNDELSRSSIPESHRLISFSRILNEALVLKITYISIDVEVGFNCSRPTKQQLVLNNTWPRRLALDVDTIRAARHDVALFNQHQSLRQALEHDTARLEVSKCALLNINVSVNPQDASCICLVNSVALKVAHVHFESRLW